MSVYWWLLPFKTMLMSLISLDIIHSIYILRKYHVCYVNHCHKNNPKCLCNWTTQWIRQLMYHSISTSLSGPACLQKVRSLKAKVTDTNHIEFVLMPRPHPGDLDLNLHRQFHFPLWFFGWHWGPFQRTERPELLCACSVNTSVSSPCPSSAVRGKCRQPHLH